MSHYVSTIIRFQTGILFKTQFKTTKVYAKRKVHHCSSVDENKK